MLQAIKKEPPDLYSSLDFLDPGAKKLLKSNLDHLYREISYWNKYYNVYSRLQLYSLSWTILASVLVPILAQAIDNTIESKWFLTLVSIHASVLLAFNKGLSVEDRLQLYRDAENDFSDLNRTVEVRHEELGETTHDIIKKYIKELDDIIVTVRLGELKKVVLPEPSAVETSANTQRGHS